MPNAYQHSGPLVAVLAYDGLCTFEFGVAYEVFGLPRPEIADGWYHYSVCGIEEGPMQAAGGLTVVPDSGLEVLEEADLIIVPGWRSPGGEVPVDLVEALRRAHGRGARLASLCSGVFVLAATGLLDGRQATTHWRYADKLRACHPAITVTPDVLYVDEGSLLTAAGSAAGIDLCLHIVRQDYGPDIANSVARRLVVPPHRDGGQAQFIERPVPRQHEGARLSAVIDWMRTNLAETLTIDRLAEQAGMSSRTFQRRFEETTGAPPGEWIVQERLSCARELLEHPEEMALEQVAELSGFGSPEALRYHFRLRLRTTPSAYRARFGR
ncbi:transcriptional regulator FtrA [Microvirga sp. P5_D2]